MACPYCGSGDWGYEMDGDGSPVIYEEFGQCFYIDRTCECRECGKPFVCREEYRYTDMYECLELLSEIDEDEEVE